MKTNFLKIILPTLTLLVTMCVSMAFTSENKTNDVAMIGYYFNGEECINAGLVECSLAGNDLCTLPLLGQIWKERNGLVCITKLYREVP